MATIIISLCIGVIIGILVGYDLRRTHESTPYKVDTTSNGTETVTLNETAWCADCGRSFDTETGLAIHRNHMHKGE